MVSSTTVTNTKTISEFPKPIEQKIKKYRIPKKNAVLVHKVENDIPLTADQQTKLDFIYKNHVAESNKKFKRLAMLLKICYGNIELEEGEILI